MKKAKQDIPISRNEIVVQVLAFIGILYVTFLMIFKFGSLPESIPINYNAMGEPTDWGGKSSLILIYCIDLIMYIGLTVLERFPQVYNYPVSITEENIRKQYFLARLLITTLKLSMVVIFLMIIASDFQTNTEESHLLMGEYFIFFALAITFIPIIIYFILSIRNK